MLKKRAIPKFQDIREEARFWDTHDTTEFEDEFHEVKVRFTHPLLKQRVLREEIVVQLQGEPLQTLHGLARSRRVKADALVREWILEKLREANRSHVPKSA